MGEAWRDAGRASEMAGDDDDDADGGAPTELGGKTARLCLDLA